MYLNGCSRKLCPMQVGCTDNCQLTKEQCPYFTQDIDLLKVPNQIKAEIAREIFAEIYEDCFDQYGYIDYDALAELKKKYIGDKR